VKQDQTQQTRLKKLKEILATLESGKHVQNRKLKTWLTADEYTGFESNWEDQKYWREFYKDKPDAIKGYEARLKKALFAYNRYDNYSHKGNKAMTWKFGLLSDGAFEKLLEYLSEIIDADQSLRMWFDRPIDFSFGNDFSLFPVGVPRIITSRSLDNLGNTIVLLSKNEVKRNCVEIAINTLKNSVVEIGREEQESKLKKMLRRIKIKG